MFDLKVAPADQFQMRTRSVSIGSPFTGEEIIVFQFIVSDGEGNQLVFMSSTFSGFEPTVKDYEYQVLKESMSPLKPLMSHMSFHQHVSSSSSCLLITQNLLSHPLLILRPHFIRNIANIRATVFAMLPSCEHTC